MSLSKRLKQITESPANPVVISKPVAASRAKQAHKHCPTCRDGMEEVMGATLNGTPIKWSWESLWVLACPEHAPWIKAAYDDTYITWLEGEVEAFRKAYKLVQETIELWNDIAHVAEQVQNGVIENDDYLTQIEAIQRRIHPEMHDFAPDLLPDCLQRIKDDGILLSGELARATWKPPVSWTT